MFNSSPVKLRFRPPMELQDWRNKTGIAATKREKAYKGELDDEDPLYIQLHEDMKFLLLDEKEMELQTQMNIDAAQEQIDKSSSEKAQGEVAMKCWNFVFDVSSAVISIVDVVTDVLVAWEFYQNPQQRIFFILSAMIFVLAQTGYSTWFVAVYVKALEQDLCVMADAQFFCAMAVVFPFGQLVPIFMWLDSYDFEWMNKLKSCLRLSLPRQLTYNTQIHVRETDRLRSWAREKMYSHGGFIIEAAIEGFPQSILQMVAIVVFQRATPLNVVSIILSMVSVASKTVMFAYSVDLFTFSFKFLCMVLDIFNIFAILSWVFFNPENPGVISLIGQIWLWKVGIMVGLIIGWFLLLAMLERLLSCIQSGSSMTYSQMCVDPCTQCIRGCCNRVTSCGGSCVSTCNTCCIHPIRDCVTRLNQCMDFCRISGCCWSCWWCGMGWMACVVDMCHPRKCQCCREYELSCPSWEDTHPCLSKCVEGVFKFLFFVCLIPILIGFGLCIGLMGFEIMKLSVIAIYFSHLSARHPIHLQFFKPFFQWALRSKNTDDYYLKLAVANYVIAESRDPCFRDSRAKKLTEKPLQNIKPWELREYFAYTFADHTKKFADVANEFRSTYEQAGIIGKLMVVFLSTFWGCLYIIIPAIFLSWLLSLLFPIVAFVMTPFGKITLLQLALTGTYLLVLLIVLCLLPRVLRFQHANFHLVAVRAGFFERGISATETFMRVKKHYANLLATKERNELLRHFFHDDKLFPMMMEYLPEVHVVDNFDEIEYLLDEDTVTTKYSLFDLFFERW